MQTTYFPIQHLDKPEIKPSGLCELFFTPKENVQFWPDINPNTGTYTDGIVLFPETTWYRCQVIDQDRDFKEATKIGEAGPYTDVSVEGFLPDNSPVNTLSVAAMSYHQYIIVLKERNGMMRLIGNEDVGATFTRTYESADLDGSRGHKLVFSWQSPLPPAIYLTAVTASGEIINPPWEGGGGVEHDPTVPAWVKAITVADINRWNLSYGWGNHATAGYLTKAVADGYYATIGHTHTWDSITGKPDDIEFQVGDVTNELAPEVGTFTYTDPILIGRTIRLSRGSRKTVLGFAANDGFQQPNGVGTVIVKPAWDTDEYVTIEIVK